jgi:hypothetical protein
MKFGGNLFENLGIKIIALLFALALYAHVLTEQPAERVLYFPLRLEGLADSLALRTPPPEQLGAQLRGTGKQIIRLSILRPPVVLHLDGVGVGQYQRALTAADFKAVTQEGVEVIAPAEPASLTLQIEPRATAWVPVAVRFHGKPARGYALVGPVVPRPSEVRVSGPRSWVHDRDSLETEPVAVGDRRDTVDAVLPLAALPAWASASPGSVLVEVPIEPENSGVRELVPVVNGLRGSYDVSLEPPRVRVSWAAPRSQADRVERDLRASVELGHRGRGRFLLPVAIAGRGADYVRGVVPDSVTVVVQ